MPHYKKTKNGKIIIKKHKVKKQLTTFLTIILPYKAGTDLKLKEKQSSTKLKLQ